MSKQIIIDPELCIACSTCWILDNEHFEQGADGKAKVKNGATDTDLQSNKIVDNETGVSEASTSCPVGAITVKDIE